VFGFPCLLLSVFGWGWFDTPSVCLHVYLSVRPPHVLALSLTQSHPRRAATMRKKIHGPAAGVSTKTCNHHHHTQTSRCGFWWYFFRATLHTHTHRSQNKRQRRTSLVSYSWPYLNLSFLFFTNTFEALPFCYYTKPKQWDNILCLPKHNS
jgi:hypothetical protein